MVSLSPTSTATDHPAGTSSQDDMQIDPADGASSTDSSAGGSSSADNELVEHALLDSEGYGHAGSNGQHGAADQEAGNGQGLANGEGSDGTGQNGGGSELAMDMVEDMMQDLDRSEGEAEVQGVAPANDDGKRVKVYELRDQSWFDRGTGHCKGIYDDTQDLALLIVEPEDMDSRVEADTDGEGGFLKDDLYLLSAKVEKEDIYARQQDTLIVWTEPSTNLDIALSFQDAEGCEDIWQFICEVQKHLNCLPSESDQALIPSSSSPLSGSPVLGTAAVGAAAADARAPWQPPSLGNIRDQLQALKMQSRSAPGRERSVEHIITEASNYIQKLIGVFEQAEDLESVEDLHALCSLMQTIIMFNDNGILEYILQNDTIFEGVIGMLEYDPEFPTLKASFRQFFREISVFKQVVEIKDASIRHKIHQTYRLQYLKEVVLARLLDDPTFGILNGFIFFNQVDIVGHVQSNDALLTELFAGFKDSVDDIDVDPTPSGPAATSPEMRKKRDTVLFLHQLMLMGKSLQVQTRLALYRTLVDRGLLFVIEWAFRRPESDAKIIHAGAEMLTLATEHDVQAVRSHVLKEFEAKRRTLIREMITMMSQTGNMGLLSQMADTFRTLLEFNTENEHFFSKQRDGLVSEHFATHFYDVACELLFKPLMDLPNIKTSSDAVKLDRRMVTLVQHLVELLSFCVLNHSHRSSFFILSNPISRKVCSVLYLKDKPLRHAALRFIRSCLKTPNHFIHRHFVKNDLFSPVIALLEEESSRDNMLSSSCLDILEHIRRETIKPIINHLFDAFRPRLDQLASRPFFRSTIQGLSTKYEQINEPPPPPPAVDAESSRAWSNREKEAEQEEYFNASDDEEKPPATKQKQTPNRGPPPKSSKKPPHGRGKLTIASVASKRARSGTISAAATGSSSENAASPIIISIPAGSSSSASPSSSPSTAATSPSSVKQGKQPALGLDYEDNSDSEGSTGGSSPRAGPSPSPTSRAKSPKSRAEPDSLGATATPELAEDLGDVAMKMRQKRQREEDDDGGFARLLAFAGAAGGGARAGSLANGAMPDEEEDTVKSPSASSPTTRSASSATAKSPGKGAATTATTTATTMASSTATSAPRGKGWDLLGGKKGKDDAGPASPGGTGEGGKKIKLSFGFGKKFGLGSAAAAASTSPSAPGEGAPGEKAPVTEEAEVKEG